jgi:hypothetical protein
MPPRSNPNRNSMAANAGIRGNGPIRKRVPGEPGYNPGKPTYVRTVEVEVPVERIDEQITRLEERKIQVVAQIDTQLTQLRALRDELTALDE